MRKSSLAVLNKSMSGPSNPKIAVLTSFSGEGGVERMLVNLMQAFVNLGIRVDLLRIRSQGAYAAKIPREVNIVDLATRHALSSISSLYSYFRNTSVQAMLVAKDRPSRAAIIARSLARSRTRLVLRLGTNLSASLEHRSQLAKWGRFLPSRMLYRYAERIVAVSQGVAEDTARITRLPPSRIRVVHNPVLTPDLFAAAKQIPDHPWLQNKTTPIVLGVGRLTKQKDFPTLIKAVAHVRTSRPVRLIVLGEGSKRPELERLIKELKLQDSVDLPGFHSNPFCCMQRADVFVLSSLWEGSPNVLTEAMALGTPVISTDCPSGPREILENGRYGPLVKMGDALSMAEGIERLLDAPPDKIQLRNAVYDYHFEVSAIRYLEELMPGWSEGATDRPFPR
jgi:glycosyltransferase involved in cell wall biosynthesis